MKKALLALANLLPPEMALLEKDYELIRLKDEHDPEKTLSDHKKDIIGIVSNPSTPVSKNLIEALPNLEIIAQFGVGIDNIDLDAAKAAGVRVTNTPEILTDDTADIALGLLLAVARRVVEGDMYVRVGQWHNGPMPLGLTMSGKKAGIVGLGRIGRAIATRLKAFNCEVLYTGRSAKSDAPYIYVEDIKDMAEECDFLILACAGTSETRNMINESILKALGAQGILINIARGSVVNEVDLVNALQNGWIKGAGLDVYANEPHVPDELKVLDNVVLLPHIGSATRETRTAMGKLVVANIRNHFSGSDLVTPVV